jgi:hypothetical protein
MYRKAVKSALFVDDKLILGLILGEINSDIIINADKSMMEAARYLFSKKISIIWYYFVIYISIA